MFRRRYLPGRAAGTLAAILVMAAGASAEPLPLRAELWHSQGTEAQMDGMSAGARLADLGVVQFDYGRRQFAAGGEPSKVMTMEWRLPQPARGPQWSLKASDEHLAAERITTLQIRLDVRF
jgi:hypothetical protein